MSIAAISTAFYAFAAACSAIAVDGWQQSVRGCLGRFPAARMYVWDSLPGWLRASSIWR